MSWYADIEGELETALAALPLVKECFGPWLEEDAETRILIEKNRKDKKLSLCFGNVYRNLGRHIDHEIYKIAQAYPKETKGELHLFSSDGDYCHEALRTENGRLYRRLLGPEEEVFPQSVAFGEDKLTIFVTADELPKRRRRARIKRRSSGGRRT